MKAYRKVVLFMIVLLVAAASVAENDTGRIDLRALVDDTDFQADPCRNVQHQVFLHQAVLCALLAKRLGKAQIRALPPEYSYPLHMHDQVPAAQRAVTLNELVCAVYEDELPLEGLVVREPLQSWLQEKV